MNYNHILVIKLSAIGDVIHTLPAVHALRQNNPDARITWMVEKPAYDLLKNNPDLDQILIFEKAKFKTLVGLRQQAPALSRLLNEQRFDLAIDFQGLFKSAAISLLSGAVKRVGYCDMREMSGWVSPPTCGEHRQGHVIDRYLDVVRGLGEPIKDIAFPIQLTEQEITQAEAIAKQVGLQLDVPYVILAPGTNWPTKCWPTYRFAELADVLASAGLQAVIVGGPGDRPLAAEISRQCRQTVVDVTGQTSLKQLAYIIKKGAVFIGGDTGPMHLAVAVDTPVVALFGPTDPARNGPYQGSYMILRPERPCLNCWKRVCPAQRSCLAEISAAQVYQVIKAKYV